MNFSSAWIVVTSLLLQGSTIQLISLRLPHPRRQVTGILSVQGAVTRLRPKVYELELPFFQVPLCEGGGREREGEGERKRHQQKDKQRWGSSDKKRRTQTAILSWQVLGAISFQKFGALLAHEDT